MLWVPLVRPFNFYLNLAHHTVSKVENPLHAEVQLDARNLADQLTLFKPWGGDYARHTTTSPPGFKMLSTPEFRQC